MKRWYTAALAGLCLLLGGCSALSLPRGEEPGGAVLLSVLGVRQAGKRVDLTAVSQGKEGAAPVICQGQGESIAGAVQLIRSQGKQPVSWAHVEHIMLEERAVESQLGQILSWSFQDQEQSTETNLWILKGASTRDVFQGDEDLATQLDTLKKSALAGESLPLRSLRELSAQMTLEGCVLIPTLEWDGEQVSLTGYAVCQEDRLVGYLTDETARGAAILAGERLTWPVMADGRALEVETGRCTVRARWEEGSLVGVEVDCEVEGRLTQSWARQDREGLEKNLASQLADTLEKTAAQLQSWGVDGPGVCRRAGLAAPWRWNALKDQWQACFTKLDWQFQVDANLI